MWLDVSPRGERERVCGVPGPPIAMGKVTEPGFPSPWARLSASQVGPRPEGLEGHIFPRHTPSSLSAQKRGHAGPRLRLNHGNVKSEPQGKFEVTPRAGEECVGTRRAGGRGQGWPGRRPVLPRGARFGNPALTTGMCDPGKGPT